MTEWDEDRHGYRRAEMQVDGRSLLALDGTGIDLASDATARRIYEPAALPAATLVLSAVPVAYADSAPSAIITTIGPLLGFAVLAAQLEELVREQPAEFQAAFTALKDQEIMRLRQSIREWEGTDGNR